MKQASLLQLPSAAGKLQCECVCTGGWAANGVELTFNPSACVFLSRDYSEIEFLSHELTSHSNKVFRDIGQLAHSFLCMTT